MNTAKAFLKENGVEDFGNCGPRGLLRLMKKNDILTLFTDSYGDAVVIKKFINQS
jgi:hypothetical protein